MRILVTGSTGFLGPYLVKAFSDLGDIIETSRTSADYQCNLTQEAYVRMMMEYANPDIIIHAAALTDIEECKKDPSRAIEVNCKATENLVRHAPLGCRFIYISTDMVYSGPGPHRENSRSESPLNMYGLSKYMGEFAAAKHGNHLIVRTNMFGFARSERKSSLVDFLIQKFKSGTTVQLFNDSFFSPLSATTLCRYLEKMARTDLTGIYNLGSTGGMSKLKFGLMLANELGLPTHNAVMTSAASIPDRAPRPLDTRLDITRIESRFGFTLPTLESEIKAMCKEHQCAH